MRGRALFFAVVSQEDGTILITVATMRALDLFIGGVDRVQVARHHESSGGPVVAQEALVEPFAGGSLVDGADVLVSFLASSTSTCNISTSSDWRVPFTFSRFFAALVFPIVRQQHRPVLVEDPAL